MYKSLVEFKSKFITTVCSWIYLTEEYFSSASTTPAIFIILASYSGCDRTQAVGYFVASMAFMAGFYSSVKINAMDIAPNYAGTCSAFVNGLAAVSGIITPYLVGLLTPDVSALLVLLNSKTILSTYIIHK